MDLSQYLDKEIINGLLKTKNYDSIINEHIDPYCALFLLQGAFLNEDKLKDFRFKLSDLGFHIFINNEEDDAKLFEIEGHINRVYPLINNLISYFKADKFSQIENPKDDELSIEGLFLFNHSLRLTYIDHNLVLNKEFAGRVITTYEELTNSENKPANNKVFEFLLDKAKIILRKLILRASENSFWQNTKFGKTQQTLNGFTRETQENKSFVHFNKRLDVFEQKGEFFTETEDLSVDDLKYLTFYKKLRPPFTEQPVSYYEEILDRFKEIADDKNSLAYKITYNYFFNNLVSRKIESGKSLTLEKIEALVQEIIRNQQETGVRNYFPYKKIIEHLLNYDNIHFDSDVEELFKKKLRRKLDDNFEWCKNQYFIHFQFPKEECFEDNGLFLESAFILPLDYAKIQNDIADIKDNLKDKVNAHKISMLAEQIKKTEEQLKNQIKTQEEESKKSLENQQKRQIQILSIFAAIVMFSAGNVTLFSNIKSGQFQNAIWASMSFALGLAAFIALVIAITQDKLKKHQIYIFCFIAIFLLLFFVFGHKSPFFEFALFNIN